MLLLILIVMCARHKQTSAQQEREGNKAKNFQNELRVIHEMQIISSTLMVKYDTISQRVEWCETIVARVLRCVA